jgi:gamma-glutamylcyclotransferase (GGCT)/AIG2-like uncharacterized protein YtfP
MEYIFVYGLFRDHSKRLLGDSPIYCGKSFVKGKLYKVNEFYPGFIRDGNSKVWGDVYIVDPINFPQMDEYEGEEYIRKKIITSTDIECWIYEYQFDVTNFKQIECGDWMLR